MKQNQRFRIKFLQEKSNKKISEGELNSILILTAGHGKLTRLSIEAYLSEDHLPTEDLAKVGEAMQQSNNLVNFILSKNKVQSLLLEIWRCLTPSEQKYLRTFDEEYKSIYLEQINLISNNKISIPLFEEFIKKQTENLLKESGEKILFDKNTMELKKGEIILSDQLTSSEFKLLKFFIENEEKVLTRDDVINAVWKDLSSTAGVSEQALDQLIFRLRKKIEENPNSPGHIQTIKGRGFKFTA